MQATWPTGQCSDTTPCPGAAGEQRACGADYHGNQFCHNPYPDFKPGSMGNEVQLWHAFPVFGAVRV